MPGRSVIFSGSSKRILIAKLWPCCPSATFADTAIDSTTPSTGWSGYAIANTRALWPISTFAMSASSTLTSVWMLAGFAIVIRLEPGMFVELEIAVSPTLMSSVVTVPSIGEIDARLAEPVLLLLELRARLLERLAARHQVDFGDLEVVRRRVEAVLVDELALVQALHAVPLRAQVLDLQLLALDRDLLHAHGGLLLIHGGAQALIVDLQHELAARDLLPFVDVDGRHAADLLGRELDLFLVHELARRQHRRLDDARRELLDLDLDGTAAAHARLNQRHGHDEHDDADDEQQLLVHDNPV